MIDPAHPWPPGFRGRSAILTPVGLLILIAGLYLVDRPVSVWAQALPQPVRDFMEWMTRWGESDWVLIPALILLVVAGGAALLVPAGRWRAAARELAAFAGFFMAGVGLTSLVATLLKRAIGRGRPETWTAEAPLSFRPNFAEYAYQGFPSGHATTAFSLAMVLVFIWPRAFWPALVFAVLVSLSRIVEGQHYPADITAGAVLGILGAYLARHFFASRGWLFARTADGRIVRKPFAGLKALLARQAD